MVKSPIQPVDDAARALAQALMADARHAALGVLHPDTGAPHVTRIGFALGPDRQPVSLVSTLALHTRALLENPACSLLIGKPPSKGDPLAFPRMTLAGRAEFVARPDDAAIRDAYLKRHPKSRLYVDFADFHFVRFALDRGDLNGGFGKAYALTPTDLA
jgi:heme oxygenase (biliverdin-IX-beta and delta-forming)